MSIVGFGYGRADVLGAVPAYGYTRYIFQTTTAGVCLTDYAPGLLVEDLSALTVEDYSDDVVLADSLLYTVALFDWLDDVQDDSVVEVILSDHADEVVLDDVQGDTVTLADESPVSLEDWGDEVVLDDYLEDVELDSIPDEPGGECE